MSDVSLLIPSPSSTSSPQLRHHLGLACRLARHTVSNTPYRHTLDTDSDSPTITVNPEAPTLSSTNSSDVHLVVVSLFLEYCSVFVLGQWFMPTTANALHKQGQMCVGSTLQPPYPPGMTPIPPGLTSPPGVIPVSLSCRLELNDYLDSIDNGLENLQTILNAQNINFDSSPLFEVMSHLFSLWAAVLDGWVLCWVGWGMGGPSGQC